MTESEAGAGAAGAAEAAAPVRPAPTVAVVAGAVLGLGIAAAGVVLSRVDLVLLALPLLAAVAWARDLRPADTATAPPTVTVTDAASDDGPPAWEYRVAVPAPRGTDAVQLRLRVLGGVPRDLVLSPATAADLRGRVPVLHSGPQEVVALEQRAIGTDASWVSSPSPRLRVERVRAPTVVAVRSLVLPHRLQGLTGAHDSARPGDGGEFRDVHPFAPGDRLRRIDWKATARRAQLPGDLYVRRTAATADATVVLAVDACDDVGQDVAGWTAGLAWEQGTTSLDLARQAAASLAVAYSRAGDRVAYQDLSTTARLVPAGGGNRHLDRVLRAVAATRASGVRASRRRAPVLAPGALVYLLSTFLDDETVHVATLWRAAGHRVVAVDVLPDPVTDGLDERALMAYRLVALERQDRLAATVANGVELVRWAEKHPGDRAAALRALSRPVRGGRTR
jgi:uncharacterized protein (DUF58 family)